MKPSEELKKIADDLANRTAQVDKKAEGSKGELKGKLVEAIYKANLNEISDYVQSVLKRGFDGYESEFRTSIVNAAVNKVLGSADAKEADELDLWEDPDVEAALAEVVWSKVKGGQNLLKFLY